MKNKILIVLAWMGLVPGLMAQTIQEGDQAIVYYLPRVHYEIIVRYQVKECIAGPYAEYAEEMLGYKNAVTEDHNEYEIKNIRCGVISEADRDKAHKVLPVSGYEMQLLSLYPNGQLRGYNLSAPAEGAPKNRNPRLKEGEVKIPRAAQYMEDALHATTDRERAEAVRDQILHLRESRFYLLTGESETVPQDGKQLEVLLKEIQEQEIQLTKLFVGTYQWTEKEDVLTMDAAKAGETIVGRWNEEEGLVSVDGEGTPIRIVNKTETVEVVPAATNAKPDKKAPKPSAIVSVLPGHAEMEVYLGEEKMSEMQVSVPQLGVEIPFTMDLFRTGNKTHIQLSEMTGEIITISQE